MTVRHKENGVQQPDAAEVIAEHLASVQYADLPARVVAAAKAGILDTLGCALAGTGRRRQAAHGSPGAANHRRGRGAGTPERRKQARRSPGVRGRSAESLKVTPCISPFIRGWREMEKPEE